MIKFCKHFINNLSPFNLLNLLNIYEKLKLINNTSKFLNNFIKMFNNVNKTYVLQRKF